MNKKLLHCSRQAGILPVKTLVLFALLILVACGSDRGDPLGVDDGSSLSGQNLANAAVDNNSALEFYLQILPQLHASFNKAQSISQSLSRDGQTVNFLGDYTGNALGTSHSINTLTAYLPEMSIRYNDFSNNGRLFFGGTIRSTCTWRKKIQTAVLATWILDGSARFAGDFAGSIEFDNLHVGLDSTGSPVNLLERVENPMHELPLTGTVLIISGNNRIIFTPNEVDWPKGW